MEKQAPSETEHRPDRPRPSADRPVGAEPKNPKVTGLEK
jgi:hypothetical protein